MPTATAEQLAGMAGGHKPDGCHVGAQDAFAQAGLFSGITVSWQSATNVTYYSSGGPTERGNRIFQL